VLPQKRERERERRGYSLVAKVETPSPLRIFSSLLSLFFASTTGPLFWGPLSERIGRRPVFLIALLCYTGFNLGCALAQNTATILIMRFLAGSFGAAPLTTSGGVIADIWDVKRRGIAMSVFSL